MSETPFLSVIVPTRKRNRQLGDCLRSLAQQDYPPPLWEAIVVFDGEDFQPDPGLPAAAGRTPLTMVTQPHAGCGMARNTGASRARGRFVVLGDDDCQFPPDWLSRYAQAFALDQESLVAGRSVNASRDNPYSQTTQDIVDYLQSRASAPVAVSNNFAAPAKGFHDIGGFHPRYYRRPPAAEDRDFSFRWISAGRRIVDAPGIVVYHSHALDLWSFLRQHYNYGSGAYVLHRTLAQGGSGRGRQPADFYLSLLLWPFSRHRGSRSAWLWPLILGSQCAQIAGYVCQWFRGA
jgi:glycosyltransferase involved in cell wall biosynthesis